MMANGDADALLGTADVRELALQRLQVVPRVLAENRDEQIFLAVEVKIDRAVRDARRFGDLRDLGVEVAVQGEDFDGSAKDAFALGRAAGGLSGRRECRCLPGHAE